MQVIKHDMFDTMIANDLIEQSPTLKKTIDKGVKTLSTFEDLSRDIFYSLYKPEKAELATEVPLTHKYNKQQIEKMLESQTYKQLREYTQLDEFGSALGCQTVTQEIVSVMENNPDIQDAIKKTNEAMEKRKVKVTFDPDKTGGQSGGGGGDIPDEITVSPSDGTGDDSPSDETGEENIEYEYDITPEEAQALQDSLDRANGAMRRAVNNAVTEALEQAEENDAVFNGFGIGNGELKRESFENKSALLKAVKNSRNLKEVAKLVGRLKAISRNSKKAKLSENKCEIHDITQGNDINHLLTQELVKLKNPILKKVFYKDFVEKKLLQYDLNNRDSAGQGDIICLIDSSGSMDDREGAYTRSVWAKAIALSLADTAKKQQRGFAYNIFSGRDAQHTGEAEKGKKMTPMQLVELAEFSYGGGTNFEQPLRWAFKKIGESAWNKADVVIITDGECRISGTQLDEILVIKSQKDCSVYMMVIGLNAEQAKRYGDLSWCDQILEISDKNLEVMYSNI